MTSPRSVTLSSRPDAFIKLLVWRTIGGELGPAARIEAPDSISVVDVTPEASPRRIYELRRSTPGVTDDPDAAESSGDNELRLYFDGIDEPATVAVR